MPMISSNARLLRTLRILRVVLPVVIGVFYLIPIFYLAAQSLAKPFVPPPSALTIIPGELYPSNYLKLFDQFYLLQPMLNSLFVEAFAVPLTLITASLAGFAMSQLPLHVRRRFLIATILLMLVPLPALWVPRFILFRELGLIDNLLSLATPALMGTNPFYVLVFYWTFRRVTQSVFEAARLDGANLFQVWLRIALPLAKPSLAVVSVLAFTLYWNDYMSPLMYIRQIPLYPIALRLQILQNGDVTLQPIQMAGVIVTLLPVLILFLLVQRYFWPEGRTRGMFAGE